MSSLRAAFMNRWALLLHALAIVAAVGLWLQVGNDPDRAYEALTAAAAVVLAAGAVIGIVGIMRHCALWVQPPALCVQAGGWFVCGVLLLWVVDPIDPGGVAALSMAVRCVWATQQIRSEQRAFRALRRAVGGG